MRRSSDDDERDSVGVGRYLPQIRMSATKKATLSCPRCQGRVFVEHLPEPNGGDVLTCLACGWCKDVVEYVPPPRAKGNFGRATFKGMRL